MPKAVINYLYQSIIISVILSITYYLFTHFFFPSYYSVWVYFIILTLFLINAGVFSYLVFTSYNNSEAFTRRFLASTMLKIFAYLIFILAVVFSGIPQIKVFLVAFLLFYVVFTFHEISSILQHLKKISSNRFKSK